MSTRSGKRIHKSFGENILNETTEVTLKSERKTRSRRLKENCDTLNISLPKTRRPKNYVRYPTDDEVAADVTDGVAVVGQPVLRSLRKTTLKEINIDVITATKAAEKTDDDVKEKPPVRLTRKSRKVAENLEENEALHLVETENAPVANKGKKSKKNKRKKPSSDSEERTEQELEEETVRKKSRKNKKNGKGGNSIVVEEIVATAAPNMSINENSSRKSLNMTNTSMESFHSAAGSPQERKSRTPKKEATKLNGTSDELGDIEMREDNVPNADATLTLEDSAPLGNALNNASGNAIQRSSAIPTGGKILDMNEEKDPNNDTLTNLNTTFDKGDEPRTAPQKTIDNDVMTKETIDLNNENLQLRDNHTSADTPKQTDRVSTTKALDTTFDKLSDISIKSDSKKLNSTYDKLVNGTSSPVKSKSSLMSSDNSESNLTFDKSDENMSRVSLTSDDSKSSTENILNTTPVLIESSMDSSGISEPSPNPPTPKSNAETTKQSSNIPLTPFKREGTFTKDGPDVIFVTSPKQKQSTESTTVLKTPVKLNKSPTSPGRTPFHSKEKAPKEKSFLNRTHSVEKPTRQSLVAMPAKITRVTFCSPVNGSVLNTQRKSKIIKSSLKGSNKTFAFEEKGTPLSPAPPASRKRSYTQPEAEQTRAKRTRLADDLQTSVDRLSRPRTLSANAKPTDVTPSKPVTPAAKSEHRVTRSRLPDFAALHQRRFQKMESLDECQERKAKRAKQMLVPTGSLAVLERSSPKASEAPASTTKERDTKKLQSLHTKAEQPKSQPLPTKTDTLKLQPLPTKIEPPKLQPLPTKIEPPKSQPLPTKTDQTKPAYTRFGYKLNLDVNPFSIPSQNPDYKASKPQLKRQPTLPSLAGSTVRKEQAKQVILREKSATILKEKRGIDRKESRTIIKGVRTNRRFELQMRSRNING